MRRDGRAVGTLGATSLSLRQQRMARRFVVWTRGDSAAGSEFAQRALLLGACATRPAPATASRGAADGQATAAARTERPGLGTQWGETRASQVSEVGFRRASQTRPLATAKIHYNDATGIRAMVGALDLQRTPPRLGSDSAGCYPWNCATNPAVCFLDCPSAIAGSWSERRGAATRLWCETKASSKWRWCSPSTGWT